VAVVAGDGYEGLARDFILEKVFCNSTLELHKGMGGKEWWDFRVFGAFSGEVDEGGGVGGVTESALNKGYGEQETAELLVVCNKLETGFDEPRMAFMYIDR